MNHSQGEPHIAADADCLPAGRWYPANHQYILKTMNELFSTPAGKQPVAVFDFDNTCIFRDIGQAVFRHQLLTLQYKIPPQLFTSLLPEEQKSLADRPMQQIVDTLSTLYTSLWSSIRKNKQQDIIETTTHRQFTALLLWFTEKARQDPALGPRYVLPLMAKLLAGHTTVELRALAEEVIDSLAEEPLETAAVSADFDGPIGGVTSSYALGLRPFAEMQSLVNWLTASGVQCNIISASTDWLVKATAKKLGFAVHPENIYGIRVELDDGDVLSHRDLPEYPVTFREGKVEVITKYIGKTPHLVAGDADTDYEMLTLPHVPVRLIINRNQTGIISSLYGDERYLLQGIDTSTGQFRPSTDTLGA